MNGFKAFEKGLICRGKQYAENTVFEEENAEEMQERRKNERRKRKSLL